MATKIKKTIIYIFLVALSITCLLPFLLMIVNATRSGVEIARSFTLIPGTHLRENWEALFDYVNLFRGFANSLIVAIPCTLLTAYFSAITAYAMAVYKFKGNGWLFKIIVVFMMIPSQLVSIGFYQFIYKIHMTNNFLPLILPAIAAPTCVFFMRQFMIPSLHIDIINSARIDGSKEFYTFNKIVLPIMKPAIATQAIFSFVSSWNNLFLPMILLTRQEKYTMPIMVSLLKGDIYKTEYGSIYLGLALTVLPLFIVYFLLSKYIIAGVALGGVKE